LGVKTPHYLHTPLVLGANGEKLSKQNGATAIDVSDPLATLNAAALALGLPIVREVTVQEALQLWTTHYARHLSTKHEA
jgi:glutamyl-Q tRNA(Asp) synthetase